MSDQNISRVVVWFSCGVTSAVAAKIAVDTYRGKLPIVVAAIDTGSEHADNWRFSDDVSRWIGAEILRLRSPDYTDTFDVYRKTKWLVGPAGARCSLELKKRVRQSFEDIEGDLQVFGYDAEETKRARRFVENNPLTTIWTPLIENGLTKDNCHQILMQNGIQRPVTYDLGFKNANCLARGCVKGQAGYWNHYRRHFPDQFQEMAELEREIGAAICKIEAGGVRVPVYLDELPEDAGLYDSEPAFQCGLFCGTT